MKNLKDRFKSLVAIEATTNDQVSQAGAGTKDISDVKVSIPNKPPAGLCFRVKLAGTKTGANAAMAVKIKIGSTVVITLTADDGSAVDWVAEFLIRISNSKVQKCSGFFLANTAEPDVDYAAGAVDLSAGADLVPQITSGHASDTVTCEMATVESFEA